MFGVRQLVRPSTAPLRQPSPKTGAAWAAAETGGAAGAAAAATGMPFQWGKAAMAVHASAVRIPSPALPPSVAEPTAAGGGGAGRDGPSGGWAQEAAPWAASSSKSVDLHRGVL